jgi:outer membrane protein assembly factor BamE (lipoprotein component of BamABCDE complex)
MNTPASIRLPLAALLATALLPLTGCLSADQHRAGLGAADRLTVGTVQKEIRTGMSGADVAAVLGSPNIVTTDDARREVWVYDKIASEVVQSSSALTFSPFILGTGSVLGAASGGFSQSSGATSRSDRTLTVVIKFDEQKRVRDFAYHSTQF